MSKKFKRDDGCLAVSNNKFHIIAKKVGYGLKYFNDYLDKGLFINECGWEVCPAGHRCNGVERPYYVLHMIVSGRGNFSVYGEQYRLRAMQGFIVPPNVKVDYGAVDEDPWQYYWVGMSGSMAEYVVKKMTEDERFVFSTENPDLVYAFERVYQNSVKFKNRRIAYMAALGALHEVISYLWDEACVFENEREEFVETLIKYIDSNYRGITVADLTDTFYFNRSYIYKVFKKHTGVSISRYILDKKLKESLILLNSTNMHVNSIALQVGFNSDISFCTQFKKKYGVTPSEYRANPFEQ